MSSRISLTILAFIAFLSSIANGAFLPTSSSHTKVEKTWTLHLFGGTGPQKSNANKPEAQPKKKESEPFKFVFLYGKPQYDWVTGKEMTEDSWVSKKRVDWGTSYTKYKKTQNEDPSKKNKK